MIEMRRLHDGREVASDSEDWRHTCECRMVCNMPTREQRQAYIDALVKIRGLEAAERVRATVKEMWGSNK